MNTALPQRTIGAPISIAGIGLHSGRSVCLTIKPSPPNTGIVFVRSDLKVHIPLDAWSVQDTLLSSNLVKNGVRIGTVEHILSAVASVGIDNLIIEVDAPEIPIMDGSAKPFLDLLTKATIIEQTTPKFFIKILKTIEVVCGDKWARLSPYEKGFLVNFQIKFDHPAIAQTPQSCIFELSATAFCQQIAKARTFGFLRDLHALQQQNLALGASFDNAIVLDDTQVVNKEGLLYPDEFVRHKILDALGDLYVLAKPILGKFEAYKSGHALNNQLVRALLNDKSCYEIVTFDDKNDCPVDYTLSKFI